jgi:hypothetical protein
VELGGARWPGRGGGVGELRRLEVGDGADSWGPVDIETRERRAARKARTKREDVFPTKTRPMRGSVGRPGRFRPVGAARPVGWLGQRPSGPQGRPGRKYDGCCPSMLLLHFSLFLPDRLPMKGFPRGLSANHCAMIKFAASASC